MNVIYAVAFPCPSTNIPDTPNSVKISSGIEGCSIRWVLTLYTTGKIVGAASASSATSSPASRNGHPCKCGNRREGWEEKYDRSCYGWGWRVGVARGRGHRCSWRGCGQGRGC